MAFRDYRIRVSTGAARESVNLLADGRLAVSVRAKRKGGRANERALELVAAHLGLARARLSLTAGHTATTKTVRVSER